MLAEGEYSRSFGFDEIVFDGKIIFSRESGAIVECKTCKAVWVTQSRGRKADPRDSGPDQFSEQSAGVLDNTIAALVTAFNIQNFRELYSGESKSMPYGFSDYYIEQVEKTDKTGLKKLYEERNAALDTGVKYDLGLWYRAKFPADYKNRFKSGYYEDFEPLLTIGKERKVLGCAILSDDVFVYTIGEIDETFSVITYSINLRKEIWSDRNITEPFDKNKYVPNLQTQEEYTIIFQLENKDTGDHSFLSKPDQLSVYSKTGELVFRKKMDFKIFEVNPIEERDWSECRTTHNFRATVLNNALYYPEGNSVIAFDLKEKKELWRLHLRTQIFSGRIAKSPSDEAGFTIYTLNSVIKTGHDKKIIEEKFIKFTPVYISENFTFIFYYLKLANPFSKVSLEIKDGEFPVTDHLNAIPVEKDGIFFIPGASSTYLVNEKLEVIRKNNGIVCNDIIGPHGYSDSVSPIAFGGHFAMASWDKFYVFNLKGDIKIQKTMKGRITQLTSFNNKDLAVVINSHDGYGEPSESQLSIYSASGKEIYKANLLSTEGLFISPTGKIGIVHDGNLLLKKVLINQ